MICKFTEDQVAYNALDQTSTYIHQSILRSYEANDNHLDLLHDSSPLVKPLALGSMTFSFPAAHLVADYHSQLQLVPPLHQSPALQQQ